MLSDAWTADQLPAGFRRGVMALKSGRWEEAEAYFLDVADETNAPVAWAGVGRAKSGRLLSGEVKVPEVAYCFDLARDACSTDEERVNMDRVLGDSLAEVLAVLYVRVIELRTQAGAIHERRAMALLSGTSSALVGSRTTSLFGTLASYDVFRRSGDAFQSSFGDAADVKREGHRTAELLLEVRRFMLSQGAAFILRVHIVERHPQITPHALSLLEAYGITDSLPSVDSRESAGDRTHYGCGWFLMAGFFGLFVIVNLFEEPVYCSIALLILGGWHLLKRIVASLVGSFEVS